MRYFLVLFALALLGPSAGFARGDEIVMLAEYKRHDIRVTSFCIEGHVVLVAHSDVGKGGGLQMVQLQHLEHGKIVPMRCEEGSQPEGDSEEKSASAEK